MYGTSIPLFSHGLGSKRSDSIFERAELIPKNLPIPYVKDVIHAVQPQDWFMSVDLSNAYFHVSIAPEHRCFLRFPFQEHAFQFKVLLFSLPLPIRVFSRRMQAALLPLMPIRILLYLDDWLLSALTKEYAIWDNSTLLDSTQAQSELRKEFPNIKAKHTIHQPASYNIFILVINNQ